MVMLLAIPTTVYLVSQQVQTSTKAEKSTTLAFSPVTKTASVGDKLNFDILLSPGTNLVNYVKVVIKYDPVIFSTDEKGFTVDPTSKLKLTGEPTVASGSVTMILAPTNPTDTVTTETKLGSIAFEVNSTSSTEAQISFDSTQTQIRSLGSSDAVTENVFLNGTPASVTITENGKQANDTNAAQAEDPTLTTPSANEEIPDQKPAFEGTAKPNSTVSITIHSSEAITAQVQTDTNGNWTYTPTTSLTPGSHTITISAPDSNGVLKTITQTFSVLAAQAQAAGADGTTPICDSLTSDVLANGKAPYTMSFTASGSDVNAVSKVTFNFGDGGTLAVTSGGGIGTATVSAKASHTYQTAGSYNATAVITNDSGGVSDPSTCTLAVTITGSSTSGSLSPLPKTGPSPAIVGVGALGGIIFLIGALFFFVL